MKIARSVAQSIAQFTAQSTAKLTAHTAPDQSAQPLPSLSRRHLLGMVGPLGLLTVLPLSLAACSDRHTQTSDIRPAEIDAGSTCDLDGMLLSDYPGPKAQIHFSGDVHPRWYCDTVEMFSTLLQPEQVRQVLAVFVQDMGEADWEQPRGHWFDARQGFYVVGSKRHGSMGPTLGSFRQQAKAEDFSRQYGGRVLRFAEVTPDMADLRGGAQQDGRM